MAEKRAGEKQPAVMRGELRAPDDPPQAAALEGSFQLERTGSSRLVNVDGRLGLFTPVTDEDGGATAEDNLEKIIEVLGDRVAALETENQALKTQFAQVTAASSRTPDDFATAISHSLDSLQSRLHDTKNPVSRFAVKSFDIEATVHVDVTTMGTVEYRFLKPEEAVDANRLSKIKLAVVPIPRESDEGTWSRPAFTPLLDIEEIQGIGEVYQRKLNQSGIYTISDLLTAGTRMRGQVELAAVLGVERSRLAEWLSHAELMTVKTIGGREAEVLSALGIRKLDQLAAADPGKLASDYNAWVEQQGRESLRTVPEETVQEWVQTAAAFAGNKAPDQT